MPHSALAAGLQALRAAGADTPFTSVDSVADLPFGCADELVSTAIVAEEHAGAKLRALAAHRTQITVAGTFFALSNNIGQQSTGTEYFRLAIGSPGGDRDAQGRETDLFGGIADDPVENRAEDPVESRAADQVESRAADQVESRPEDQVENRAEDPVENRAEDPVENRAADRSGTG
jgi:hypothetical protein